MPEEPSIPNDPAPAGQPAELRERLAADLAAGRTIALSAAEMADPDLRGELPGLLEELGKDHSRRASGLQIAGYTVLGEIGAGGMSTVYLARHEQLGRHVALKILQPTAGGQERARRRLLNEARAMAKLSHPHIVTVFDVVEAGDIIAIAMEWVDGLTLSGILRALPKEARDDDMPLLRQALGTPPGTDDRLESTVVRTFVRMVHDIARAASGAHAAGLLHLDIKPSNVLVRRDGTALLADFGLVREIDPSHTHTQSFAGTPIYAAPEQLRRDDGSFGAATDVYALGMTLYELLARTQPLRHEGLTEMLRRVESGRVPKLSTRVKVAHDLENIVHKAIALEPQNRYVDADALADDLLAFLDGRAVSAQPTPALQRLKRWIRAEPWKAALVAVLLVTVPVLLGLGTKLLLELPRISEINQREQRTAAVAEAQSFLQSFLMLQETHDAAIGMLEQALEATPDDPVIIACLLTQLGQDQPDVAAATLERLPAWARECEGIQALAARFAEGREFFSEGEAAQLAASDRHLDLLLVALDRALCHRDTLLDKHLVLALSALRRFHERSLEKDPLTVGLMAWIAGTLDERETLESACSSLATLWPNSVGACQWRILSMGLIDPAAAVKIGREFLATHPDANPIAVRTASELFRIGEPARALEIIDSTSPDNDGGRQVQVIMRAEAEHRMGRTDDAAKTLAAIEQPLPRVLGLWLQVLENIEPQRAKKRYLELIEEPDLPMSYYHQAIEFGVERKDRELRDPALSKAIARHPDRATFRWQLAFMHSQDRDWAATAAALDGLEIPRRRADHCGHVAANALCRTKEWDRLLQVCRRWNQLPHEDARRATYYLAIALSRTGAYTEAFTAFQRHLEVTAARNQQAMPETTFELMWLQVLPGGPKELRDPQAALTALESPRGRAILRKMPRAWFLTIAAEVYCENGDAERAIALAERAQQLLDRPYSTAPGDLTEILRRALARYR